MIVLTLEDVICIALIVIAAILFFAGVVFGWIAYIGEKILHRGCGGKEKDDEETEGTAD